MPRRVSTHGAYTSCNPILKDLMLSSGLHRHLHMCGTDTREHIKENTSFKKSTIKAVEWYGISDTVTEMLATVSRDRAMPFISTSNSRKGLRLQVQHKVWEAWTRLERSPLAMSTVLCRKTVTHTSCKAGGPSVTGTRKIRKPMRRTAQRLARC